jgi:hypothetical protein
MNPPTVAALAQESQAGKAVLAARRSGAIEGRERRGREGLLEFEELDELGGTPSSVGVAAGVVGRPTAARLFLERTVSSNASPLTAATPSSSARCPARSTAELDSDCSERHSARTATALSFPSEPNYGKCQP